MGAKILILLFSLLATAFTVPRPDFVAGGDHDHHHDHHHEHHGEHGDDEHKEYDAPPANAKKCSLVRASTQQTDECFLEPECENVCTNLTNKVGNSLLNIFYQYFEFPLLPQVCTPYQDTECTQYDTVSCNTVNEEKCETVYQTQHEEQCDTVQEKLCRDIVRQECDIVSEEKCETR